MKAFTLCHFNVSPSFFPCDSIFCWMSRMPITLVTHPIPWPTTNFKTKKVTVSLSVVVLDFRLLWKMFDQLLPIRWNWHAEEMFSTLAYWGTSLSISSEQKLIICSIAFKGNQMVPVLNALKVDIGVRPLSSSFALSFCRPLAIMILILEKRFSTNFLPRLSAIGFFRTQSTREMANLWPTLLSI